MAETTKNPGPVCVVTAGGPIPWIIINALKQSFPDVRVIVEDSEGYLTFLRRRARRLGWVETSGQLATMVMIRVGKLVTARRLRHMVASAGMDMTPSDRQLIVEVPSVNTDVFIQAVDSIRPAAILLVGCRMVTAATLERIVCPVLNYHAGITPMYRGMNGGYWALANDDRDNFGSTVHLVDRGVDTGQVVAQVRCVPRASDTIMTYAFTQAAASLQMCVDALRLAAVGQLATVEAAGPSRQWYHPPLWQYLRTGFEKGVW